MSFQLSLKQLSRFLVVLSVFAVAGCASGPDIRSDYDSTANFGAYSTYNLVDGAGPDYALVMIPVSPAPPCVNWKSSASRV